MLLPVLLLHLLQFCPTTSSPPKITTPAGLTVLGATVNANTCHQYLAIPFAQPPVGPQRWSPPQPYVVKDGAHTIDGIKYAPLCMQPVDSGWDTLNTDHMSEDCLYLNVFTPTTYEPQSLPVMVYIHGGDYLYGGANDAELNGCNLLTVTKEVVVVTLQYRLGIFGFLGSEALRRLDVQSGSTGNYGLLDQIEALQWIQHNIGVFGGNNGNVMIFGESAGAGAVTNLLAAPVAHTLYHRAAMQSGAFAAWTTKSLHNATDVYKDVLHRTQCDSSPDAIACLMQINAVALAAVSVQIEAYPDQWTVCRWAPTVDGIVLQAHPAQLVLQSPSSSINNVPIMYGNNDEEGASFLSATRMSSSDWISKTLFTKVDYVHWLQLNFPLHYATIQQEYESMFDDNDNNNTPWFVAQRIVGDYMLFCPGRRSAKSLLRTHPHVYEYMFDHVPAGKDDSYHGAEIAFVFADMKKDGATTDAAEEWELAQSMAWMWSMFGKYGNPTPPTTEALKDPPSMMKDITWKTFPNYIEMDTKNGSGLEAKENLRSQVCTNVWDVIQVATVVVENDEKASTVDADPTSWSTGTVAAVGIGLSFTVLGSLFVVVLYARNARRNQGGENYVSFLEDDEGGEKEQEMVGTRGERRGEEEEEEEEVVGENESRGTEVTAVVEE